MPNVVSVFDTKPYDRDYLGRADVAGTIQWRFHEFRLSLDTAAAAEGAFSACVFVNDVADRAVMMKLRALGVGHLALRCTGFNNVDMVAARELGIAVTRVPNYSPYSVAEHSVALLLALNRKIHRSYNRVRDFNFSLNGLVGVDLHGKVAGIVGTGRIGRLVADILHGFGMRVLCHDPFPNVEWAESSSIEYAGLHRVLAESDVVSLHVPLTPQTRHIVGRETIEHMKRGVILINVSRGRLIDTAALISGLKSGHVGGVALDVYEEEEGVFFEDLSGQVMQDDELARLLTFPNVLVTAHQAFLTREALEDIALVTVENLRRQATGLPFLEGTAL